jgi:hypothetical protein
MAYFQKTFRPDIINGDVSNVIQANASDLPFAANDILFDWVAVDLPLGTDSIVDGSVHMYGEDGGAQTNCDFNLIIAKSNDGVAPTSLGTINVAITGCYELPDILLGMMKFEGDSNKVGKLNLGGHGGSIYQFNTTGNNGQVGPVVIEPEHNALGGATTNRIYVAGIAGGAIDFSTGVLADGAVTDNAATSITTKTVDPRKSFRVGDTVYLHDVDTALGTIASMTATNITLNAAIASGTDIADEDEFMNAKPITVTLGFNGR